MFSYASKSLSRSLRRLSLAGLLLLTVATTSFAAYDFSYSGRLVDKDGKPLAGPVALKISFLHSESSTTSVLDVTTGIDNVTLKDGVFQVVLSLDGSDFQRVFPTVSQAVYIEVTDLTNAPSAPYGRQRLTMLPYAGKVPVDTSQFAWSSDGRLQLAVSGGADASAVATLTNKTIDASTNTITNISNASISATAAIADSKLATISTAGKVSGAAITSGTIAGTAAVSTSGSIATTGKVGVGAAAGTSQMEVKGGGATSATSSLNVMDSAGSSKLFVRDDGNVGIGTTSPASKLNVMGTSEQLRLGYDASNYSSFTTGSAGQLGINAGGSNQSITLTPSGTGSVNIPFSAGLGGLKVEHPFENIGAYPLEVRLSGTRYFGVKDNGSVEFNSYSPTGNTANYGDGTVFRASGKIVWNSNASYYYGGSNDTGLSRNAAGVIEVNSGTPGQYRDLQIRSINPVTGNVGIGATAPVSKLDVAGSTRVKASATSVLTGSIDPAASTTVTGVGTKFTTELGVGDRILVTGEYRTVTVIASDTSLTVDSAFSNNANDTSPDRYPAALYISDSSNATKLMISDQGNVGIGTTSPTNKLTVHGVVAAAPVLTANNTQDPFRIKFDNTLGLAIGGGNAAPYPVWLQTHNTGTDNTPYPLALNPVGGSVGIGTTNPGAKLEVNGGVRLNTATAKPTCDSAQRGTTWVEQGGAGVTDKLLICLKSAADTYSWIQISTGG